MTTPTLTNVECDEIRWTISPLDYVYQEGWADAMIRAGYAAGQAAASVPRGEPVAWQLLATSGKWSDWIRLAPPDDELDLWRPLYAAQGEKP